MSPMAAAVFPSCGPFCCPAAAATPPCLVSRRRGWRAFSSVVAMASAAQVRAPSRKPFAPPREVHRPVAHSLPPQKREIFESLDSWAADNILVLLKPVERSWQPQDYLPDAASESFADDVRELRERAREIPDDYFVCFVGNMVTEEALPTSALVFDDRAL